MSRLLIVVIDHCGEPGGRLGGWRLSDGISSRDVRIGLPPDATSEAILSYEDLIQQTAGEEHVCNSWMPDASIAKAGRYLSER